MELHLIINGLINAAPGLAVWIVALILSSVLVKKGGDKPERLLILGSSLMLLSSFLSIFQPPIANYLGRSDMSNVSAAGFVSGINIFLGLISLAGIICLFYAIWKKFTGRERTTTDS